MVFEVKCANCDQYFPLDSVKQVNNGYYCRMCYKRLKNRQCVPITTNMDVRCARCDKVIGPDEPKVKDGNHYYCARCYVTSQIPPRSDGSTPDFIDDLLKHLPGGAKSENKAAKEKMIPDPRVKCTACGKTLSRNDNDHVLDGGNYYCKECHEHSREEPVKGLMSASGFRRRGVTALRDEDKILECLHCGSFITLDRLKESKDGKVYCPNCNKILPIRFRGTWKGQSEKSLKPDDIAAKKEEYGNIAQFFKCLSDPCRVKIIELLSDHELCVFEFVEMTGFQYSAISYHLKMLKELGLIKSYERGNFMVYSLTGKGEVVHEFIEKSRDL
jgi:DNA-binding transcriptional ArsR family regulator